MEQEFQLQGISSYTVYSNGQLEDCRLNQKNIIETKYGEMIPHYSAPGIRNKELKSVSYYESGAVRSIALETQTDVQTPLGLFPAELVTFYESGELDSIFPLNGQIGFGWSEKEEKELAETVTFDLPFGSFAAKPIGLRFYKSGNLRSLILWPGEIISLVTSVGKIPVRIGIKLYESGVIESVEPAAPIVVDTPIGPVNTYDVTALGIDADFNSLRFNEEGKLMHLVTSGDILVKNKISGRRKMFSSCKRPGLTDEIFIKLPVQLNFHSDIVMIDNGIETQEFDIHTNEFLFLPDYNAGAMDCADGCDGCIGCG